MKAMEPGFLAVFLKGTFAGWLIALIAWLMPAAGAARVRQMPIARIGTGEAHEIGPFDALLAQGHDHLPDHEQGWPDQACCAG